MNLDGVTKSATVNFGSINDEDLRHTGKYPALFIKFHADRSDYVTVGKVRS